MGEIKIVVSDRMDSILQKLADDMGIKKTEFVKSLLIENLKKIKFEDKK